MDMQKAKIISIIGIIFLISILIIKADYIVNAPKLLVNFSAKVGCSLRFVTGLPESKVRDDLSIYSPLFNLVDLTFDSNNFTVNSQLLWQKKSASYKEGVGCTLITDNVENRDNITFSESTGSKTTELDESLAISINQYLAQIIERDNTNKYDTRALLVVKDGQIIGEQYARGYDKHTRFMGWSISKTLTGIIVGNMIKREKLSVNQSSLFEQWKNTDKQEIEVEHLLTMSSGLTFHEVYDPGTDATNMLFGDAASWSRAINSEKKHKAGDYWSYSSGTSNILSYLVYKAFDENSQLLIEDIRKNVLNPLGMNNTTIELDPKGSFVGSSFVYATARDWANLGQFFLAKDNDPKKSAIVEKDWLKKSVSPNTSKNENRYGYHLWLNSGGDGNNLRWSDLPADTYAARGNKGQLILIFPDHDVVIVRLGWSKKDYPINDLFSEILEFVK